MKKYNLALVYFSKAMKFFNKNGEQNYLNGGNPSIFISNHTTQKMSEVLYNYGITLLKVKKYVKAFRCFETASELLRHNPKVFYFINSKLWYYMGLCCVLYYIEV